jgi:hypothetical protein
MEDQQSYLTSRKRVIDDTDRNTQMRGLKEINPWLPQFTPEAEDAKLKKPAKRPSSPMTSRPLRVSDLIPINMHREQEDTTTGSSAAEVKFICPVSRSLPLCPVTSPHHLSGSQYLLKRWLQSRRRTRSCWRVLQKSWHIQP